MNREFKCITCGRRFPEGQGVMISRGSLTLTFHSSRCAYKFFKLLLERVDERCFMDTARDLISELEKSLELRKTRVVKRI